MVTTLIRMSAIIFLHKIFEFNKVKERIIRLLLVLSILYGLVVFLEAFLICRPMAVDWNAHVDGTCGNQIVSYLVLELLGLLLDFGTIAMPSLWILNLSMRRARKVAVISILSIGIL